MGQDTGFGALFSVLRIKETGELGSVEWEVKACSSLSTVGRIGFALSGCAGTLLEFLVGFPVCFACGRGCRDDARNIVIFFRWDLVVTTAVALAPPAAMTPPSVEVGV